MKLNIPTEKAIEILEKRKSEINSYDFEPKVWKDKTENDLREIFDGFDTKWMQISQLSFTTPFSDMKYDVLEKGKKQATQYLDAYIEQIIEYTSIEASVTDESEKYYENENKILKKQISESISSTNYILDERNGVLTELNEKNNEIKNLKENTVQLSEITLNKLLGLLKNLPIGQFIALLGSFFAIIGFAYYFGTVIQEKANMDNEFELREKLSEYKNQKKELNTKIINLEKEKTENGIIIQKLMKIKTDTIKSK